MSEEFIYLDWNVIKHLKEGCDKNSEISVILTTLKTKYRIPFSICHLIDRQKKLSAETMPLVKDDLIFLSKLSDEYMVGISDVDYQIRKKDVFDKYDEVTSYKFNKFPSITIPSEILCEINRVGFQEFFNTNDNVQFFPTIMMAALNRFDSNYQLYNKFREIFRKPPAKELEYLSCLLNKNLKATDLKNAAYNMLLKNETSEVSLLEEMGMAYLLLDFNDDFQEAVSEKSNFTNIFTDLEHMKIGSFAKYFITKDKSAKKKTSYIYKAYDVKTEVCNIDEFISKFTVNN